VAKRFHIWSILKSYGYHSGVFLNGVKSEVPAELDPRGLRADSFPGQTGSRERGRRAFNSRGGRVHAREALARASKVALVGLFVALICLPVLQGCDGDENTADAGTTSSSTSIDASQSGDIEGQVGEALEVGSALVTVRALQSTFQPAVPAQRLSDQSPSAPGAGESFYQAYVRVENRDTAPIRVDPNNFACAIGDVVVGVEPTRSGPLPRSLLKNASLDLLLTFKGPAGYEALLLYDPPWYRGTVRVSPGAAVEETTTSS
jgi:hypothetical protein